MDDGTNDREFAGSPITNLFRRHTMNETTILVVGKNGQLTERPAVDARLAELRKIKTFAQLKNETDAHTSGFAAYQSGQGRDKSQTKEWLAGFDDAKNSPSVRTFDNYMKGL
jgi:hypothetical protein